MEEQQSENQKFLEELGIKSDAGMEPEAWKGPDSEEQAPEQKEEVSEDESLKNRRERRLMAKVQSEREANIALNARLQALSEAQKLRSETTEADFLKLVDPIYGQTDETGKYDPRRVEATRLLKDALKGAYESAKREAREETLAAIREERDGESSAVAEEEENLETGMEEVEDKYGINFSSKKTHDKYLDILEEISPKDRDGDIIEYAFDAAARIFQSEEGKSSSRAKELASRSGQRSGASQGSDLQDQSFYEELRKNGLMD